MIAQHQFLRMWIEINLISDVLYVVLAYEVGYHRDRHNQGEETTMIVVNGRNDILAFLGGQV